jgi:hypothetical protein
MKTPTILGPAPCQECGRLLVWDGLFWLFRGTQIIHVRATCPARFDHHRKTRKPKR